MKPESIYSRRAGWRATWIDDDLIMMNQASPHYLDLSGSGGRIWELLETPRSAAHLCQALAREYAVSPAAIEREVTAFLLRLREVEALDVDCADVE